MRRDSNCQKALFIGQPEIIPARSTISPDHAVAANDEKEGVGGDGVDNSP